MRFALAVLCLAVMLGLVVACLGTQRRPWGVLLIVVAAAWLPINNGQLEGPVLVAASRGHGLTTADVGGLVAILVGGLTVWPPHRWRSLRWVAARAGVLVLVAGLGFTLAFFDTVERVDRQVERQHERRQERRRDQLQALLPSADKVRAHPVHSSSTAQTDTVEP